MSGIRLDHLLLERGLVRSREKARALVMAGRVRVDGRAVDKAGARVSPSAALDLAPDPHPYVSRGGTKLVGALEAFSLQPAGWTALDVGASTGGFTDCLLQHGARQVIALDVGHGQLDWGLRNDSRVVVLERFNARELNPDSLAAGMAAAVPDLDLAVVDVSFISLRLILPPLATLVLPRLVCLVKPQFEVGRAQVGKGGIVREPALHATALQTTSAAALESGWNVAGVHPSPLRGADGNREFFLYLTRPPESATSLDAGGLAAAIAAAVEATP